MTDENGTYIGSLLDERTEIVRPIAKEIGDRLFLELIENPGISPCQTLHGPALSILADIVNDESTPLPPSYRDFINFVEVFISEGEGGIH